MVFSGPWTITIWPVLCYQERDLMPKREEPREVSAVARRIREELQGRGYTIRFSTERVDEENMLARLEVVNNETRQAYAKLVGIGKIMDMDMAVGLHISEDILSDLLTKFMTLMSGLRVMVPGGSGGGMEAQVRVEREGGD